MKEMPHIRKTIEAIKQCDIKNLDEFIEMVLYVVTYGSPDDMKKMGVICKYVLEKNNYFNRGGKKYLKKEVEKQQKKAATTEVPPSLETKDTIYLGQLP